MKEIVNVDEASAVPEVKKAKKFRIVEKRSELPLGMYDADTKKWYYGYEVGKMSSDVLSQFEKDSNPFKTFGAIVAKGLVKIFDTATGEEYSNWRTRTSKIFFVDIFFLMTEIVIATKGTSLVSTVYRCPERLCGKFTKFENPIGESGGIDSSGFDLTVSDEELSSLEMEDIRALKFNPVRDLEVPEIYFHFDEGVVIGNDIFTEYVFRIPEIGDYILKSGGETNALSEKKVLLHCLKSVNGVSGKELESLKSLHGLGLLALNLNEYMKIVNKFNSMGYDYTNHKITCAHCGREFKAVFDLSNFFGSVLGR